jgi:alpha-ribazole phosphatase/probable phosphoglycerate mutase
MRDDHRGQLILIRHAQSEWNAAGRWQGHADPKLTPLGEDQALKLAAELEGETADRIYASDLRRARQTAAPIAARLGLMVEVDPDLRELDVGRWSGLTREEIHTKEPDLLADFETGDPHIRPGSGETRAELRQRARDRMALMAAEHPGERIIIVTHLGFIRALLPDAEPENASALRVTMERALTAREPGAEAENVGPL